ncbi:MAG: 2,3,4,5-tetrahydropyridine-2,6-dicarboxylate N-succinyltransferase, partial [Pseudomonadota bacterium]
MPDRLAALINAAWEDRADLNVETQGEIREAVDASLSLLDSGEVRVANPDGQGGWSVNEWLKKAVLLSFRLNPNVIMDGGPGHRGTWWDKVPSKFEGWGASEFEAAGFRAVPPATVRRGSYIAPGAVLM